ncbi:phosphatase PAP2 family protein [Candidatus Uhrbacteria bacterium]|nr:phosphatase PAP2 family protein [Candidatus Uhrbacteria bacterium]
MSWDLYLFRLANGFANQYGGLDVLGVFAAVFLLPLVGFLIIPAAFTIKRLKEEHWYELPLKAFCAGALAYGARTIIGALVERPRPFLALSDMHLLVSPEPSPAFPSGHASVAFALAFTVFTHDRDWGIALFILAGLVAVGRVFVGVHYPLDIIAGALLGCASGWVVHWLERREWSKLERALRVR